MTQTQNPPTLRAGHVGTRRIYRVKDHRLLRRLPWKSEDRAPIRAALGSAIVPETIDIKALRGREGLSREDFADFYGLSVDSVRSWERGVLPSKASRAYLSVIQASPHTVRRALGVGY
jgi:DNA-binding transcriptional regulator YiaG